MKWITTDYKGNQQVWYSGDVIEKILKIAQTGLETVCYKANCQTCKCYSKKLAEDTLESVINNYFTEEGEFLDEEGDFEEVLEAYIDRERVACNKAKPIAEELIRVIESEE